MSVAHVGLVLRCSLAACFLGHGVVALTVHPPWLAFFATFHLSHQAAAVLMPLVGALDVVVAAALLFAPCRALYLWCALWTIFTALLRPMAGGTALDVLARAGNWGPPLALLAISAGQPWWQRARNDARALPPDRRGATLQAAALLGLATLLIAFSLFSNAASGPRWSYAGPLDLAKLIERAGVVGVPLAFALLLARLWRDARERRGGQQPSATA